jgi:hypothetical protein
VKGRRKNRTDEVEAGFEDAGLLLKISDLQPLHIVSDTLKKTRKYAQIVSSIREVGIIEPPVVARIRKEPGRYLLLDGHLRVEVLKQMGETEVSCLISTDDEGFTYNKRVNRLAIIQEHKMILKAIERGVPEVRIASALNVDVNTLRHKIRLLDGICPEAADLLKDKHVASNTFWSLRRMVPRQERRGLIASAASAASEVGALLAVGVSALAVHSMSGPDLDAWGWRIPFLVGAALAASVWIARSTMQESPDFKRQEANGTVPANPLHHALTHYRIGILRAFAISALGSITYYVGITYVPAFLTSTGSLSEGDSLWLATIAAIVVIVVTPLTGTLSDWLGRKPVLAALGGCSAVLPITMFSLMASGSHLQALLGPSSWQASPGA